jgi:hypothetical protein
MRYETAREIEVAVANYFSIFRYVIVPNIMAGGGIFQYEPDLCAINCITRYATEVEIKVSKSDVQKDLDKKHHHDDVRFQKLYFAIPEKLYKPDIIGLIPLMAGILVVDTGGHIIQKRRAHKNNNSTKWEYYDMYKVARLGTIRLWVIKKDLLHKYHIESKARGE